MACPDLPDHLSDQAMAIWFDRGRNEPLRLTRLKYGSAMTFERGDQCVMHLAVDYEVVLGTAERPLSYDLLATTARAAASTSASAAT